MGKTLYLECRGCDFWKYDDIGQYSDVGNYRVGSYDYSIHAKNGRDYVLEFGAYDAREIRKNHKITGKPLKHPKIEIIKHHALHFSAQYEDKDGCWGDIPLMKEVHAKLRGYTKEDILKTVNDISVDQYDEIIFVR